MDRKQHVNGSGVGTLKFQSLLVFLILVMNLSAEPYHGRVFTYYQPDKTPFEIRLFGDEFYAVAETLDGYVVTRDSTDGSFCYARLSANNTRYKSTGVRVGQPVPAGLAKNLRITRAKMIEESLQARQRFGVDARGVLLPEKLTVLHPEVVQPAPPSITTIGTRIGLVLLAKFPDRESDVVISRSQVDAYCNDPNYTEFNNATSVYGYFNIQSGGKLQYNCTVTAYFTAAQNRDYYTDNTISYGTRARELINEGLAALKARGFDFTKCDGDNNGVLDGINCFYAGSRVNSWAQGLWPHKSSSYWLPLFDEGVNGNFQYQITNMGSSLALGTFCHENGHMICAFPDLYSYNGNAANIGYYSLMHSSGSTHPVNIDAYLKIHAGWTDAIDITSASHWRGAVQVNNDRVYRFRNPAESREYFLISMRTNSGYEGVYGGHPGQVNPTNGLVIWHAYEQGSNTYSSIFTADSPAADYSRPFELMVVEANPSSSTTPWYDNPTPGSNDGYHSGDVSSASDTTMPALKFWNTASGRTTPSNMEIHTIGAQGDAITFTIGAGPITGTGNIGFTKSSLTTSCDYGSDAASQTFAIYNTGEGSHEYILQTHEPWLSLDVPSGIITADPTMVTASFNSSNLASGGYSDFIWIPIYHSDGQPSNYVVITVHLTVHDQPTISLGSPTLTRSLKSGETGADTIPISNTGGGTLNYTLSESMSWLSLSTLSGTVAAELDEIDVTIDASGLVAGVYTGTISVSSPNATNSPQEVAVTLTVPGTFSVADASVEEGDSGTTTLSFAVTLSAAGGTATTVDYATSAGTATAGTDYTTTNSTLTFAAGETTKSASVTVIADLVDESDETLTLTLSNAVGGPTILDATATGTIIDDDTKGITVSTISGNTREDGTTATFTVVLDTQPTADVVIGLSSNDTSEGTVAPASLTFTDTDWDTPQTVTVTGVGDTLPDGNIPYSIVTAAAVSNDSDYNGLNAADVTVINQDDDIPGITVGGISRNTTEAGGTATFTIELNTAPTADVTIGLSSDDTSEGTVAPVSVTFTSSNWDTPQTVTVTGANDDIDDGNVTYSIVTAVATSADGDYDGLNGGDVTVINEDDSDTAGVTVSSISNNTTEFGLTATATLVLDSEPTADVSIGLTSSDTTEGTLAISSLTFTPANWATPQSITVTGVDDGLTDGIISYAITTAAATSLDLQYNGINPLDISLANEDDEIPPAVNLVVTPTAQSVPENSTAVVQVRLDADPGATVTVAISHSAGDTDISVSPAVMTFTSGNWNVSQTLTLAAAEDADRLNNKATILLASVVGNTNLEATEVDNDPPVRDDDDDKWYEGKCGIQPNHTTGLPFYLTFGIVILLCLFVRRSRSIRP